MDLAPRQAWLHAAGRQEAVGAAASRGAPAGAGQGDIAALEQPVLVISVIGEAADRALGARRAVAVVERAVAVLPAPDRIGVVFGRSEEHTSELQSLMRISYAVFCLKKKKSKEISSYTQTITTMISRIISQSIRIEKHEVL